MLASSRSPIIASPGCWECFVFHLLMHFIKTEWRPHTLPQYIVWWTEMQPCRTRLSPCPTGNGGEHATDCRCTQKCSREGDSGTGVEARQRVSWNSRFCGVGGRGGADRAVRQRPVQSACERWDTLRRLTHPGPLSSTWRVPSTSLLSASGGNYACRYLSTLMLEVLEN